MNTPVQGQPIPSQMSDIKSYLLAGKSITQLEALGLFRCFRLAARIEQLRKAGMNIKTEMCKDVTGKQYARYSVAKAPVVGARVITRESCGRFYPKGVVGTVTDFSSSGESVRVLFDKDQPGIFTPDDQGLSGTGWWAGKSKVEVI